MSGGLRPLDNGANDTAGSYGFVINARPDKVITDQAQSDNPNPMYPRMDKNDEKYVLSTKGFVAFIDKTWTHNSTSPFRSDIDTIPYMDNLAGLYNKGLEPWQLVSRIAYAGIVRNTILATEGTGKDGTNDWSAKRTIPNTSNTRWPAGAPLYYDPPPLGVEGGAAKMSDQPKNSNPLWVMPYDEILHKGSPYLISRALGVEKHPSDGGRFSDTKYPDHALSRHANHWLTATINTGIVLIASLLSQNELQDQLQDPDSLICKALAMTENTDSVNRKTFAENLLCPLGANPSSTQQLSATRLFAESADDLPNLQIEEEHDRKVRVSGSTFTPNSELYGVFQNSFVGTYGSVNSFEVHADSDLMTISSKQTLTNRQKLVAAQITAAEDGFYFTRLVNSFYTDRVFCTTFTSADPGFGADVVPIRIMGHSG